MLSVNNNGGNQKKTQISVKCCRGYVRKSAKEILYQNF